MYKFAVLVALIGCVASAPAPGYLAPALPAVAVAHTAVPVATSYSNTYKVSVKSPLVAATPVVAAHAAPLAYATPIVKTAPVVAAQPAVVAHAPLAYAAHAPLVAGYIH
ncbi:cuticle protein 70, isoforms A and B-like [Vespa crabro]|uniref:cuticle protein 70, isoforms A and B-like n=1 Tax=Vespa crabro TaxID=7445 RepID=UPI001EFF78CD|nr:cuticle protein 70, isoforms A and B-like [Vespa crabro]